MNEMFVMFSRNQEKMNENIMKYQEEMRTNAQQLSEELKSVGQSNRREKDRDRRSETEMRRYREYDGSRERGYDSREEGENPNYRKLELPIFTGNDPDDWMTRAERYFEYHHITGKGKVETVVVGLEGDALTWFRWEHHREPITR